MAEIDDRYPHAGTAARTDAAVDEGLRAYMVRVFNYMAGGIFLTGLVAYVTFSAAVVERAGPGRRGLTEFGQLLYNSPFKWAVMLAPLAFVLILSFRVNKMSVGAAHLSLSGCSPRLWACRCHRSSWSSPGNQSRRCSS